MKAVILCAKEKESLFPLTETTPTGLMPIGGSSAVGDSVSKLREIGVDEFYLVCNHLIESYRQEFSDQEDVRIVEQESITGTADAVMQCEPMEDDFVVLNGDSLFSKRDLSNLIKKHMNQRPECTVLATDSSRPEKFGVLSIEGEKLSRIEESPAEAENVLINTGAYVFKSSFLDRLEETDAEKVTAAVSEAAEKDKAVYRLSEDYWKEIDSLREVLRSDRLLRDVFEASVHDSAHVSDEAVVGEDVSVGPGAEIKAGAKVTGRTVVGTEAVIEAGSVVESATVGANSVVSGGRIRESLLFENSIVESNAVVQDSVLAEGVDVEAGSVLKECYVGAESYIGINSSARGAKFVPDARTDLGEITK